MTTLQMAAAAIFSGGGISALLSLNVSPSSVSGVGFGMGGSGNVVSDSATATPSNGQSPFTFLWTFVSGDTMSINTATNATTTFNKTAAFDDTVYNAVFKCTVTDDNSDTAEDTVAVQLTFTDTT